LRKFYIWKKSPLKYLTYYIFRLFCVEHLISWPGFLIHVYPTLGVGERLFLLEVCREVTSKGAHLPADAVVLISSEFKKKADIIFVAHNGLPTPDPSESAALLEAVAAASGMVDSPGASKLQEDGALLTSAVCAYFAKLVTF
jgi:hypothetical protein